MRVHGRADISASRPRATAICDRCGFMTNLDRLRWQFDFLQGPRLFNLRILVCPECYDIPQQNGRTIVLPPDPIPVANPRPENYVNADNPVSYLGFNVADNFLPNPPQYLGGNVGNMILNAGVNAAFNGTVNKRVEMSAALTVSNSSYDNWVGKNWNADPSGTYLTITSTVAAVTHCLSSFTITAPNDQGFLNSATGITGYTVDGGDDGATWTTLVSGTTAGGAGEEITGSSTFGTFYQYHRFTLEGDGVSQVAVAQVVFNISDAAANDI